MNPIVAPPGTLAGCVAAVALHGLRLVPATVLCPFLGGPLVPAGVRAALAFGLGGCAWLSAGGGPLDAASGLTLLAFAARELAIGAAIGILATIPFEAARAGGRLVDTLRGATLAELHVAPLRQRESASGDLLVQWTVVLGATAGGGRLVLSALLDTFRALPIGLGASPQPLLAVTLRGAGEVLACAVALGAPAAAGVLAGDLVLSVIGRASPQVQISASAPPARAALALLALLFPAAALAGRLTASIALSTNLVRTLVPGAAP